MPEQSGEGAVPQDEDDLLQVPSPPNINSTSNGPDGVEPSSSEDEPLPLIDVEMRGAADPEDEPEPLPEFDPRHREALDGLLFLGKTTKNFRWAGHEFLIKTPTVEDLLEAGQLHKPHVGTISDVKAWQALIAAAIVVSVDRQPVSVPLSEDDSALRAKFNTTIKWYPWTLDAIYDQYLLLDAQVQEVILAMGKA
jgi:hypothetical protein